MATNVASLSGVGSAAEERVSVASQRQLIWWRFRKHKLAMISGVVILLFYLSALGANFLAITDPEHSDALLNYMPPQPIRFFADGTWSPHVCAITGQRDLMTFKKVYKPDCNIRVPLVFFTTGYRYKFLGIFSTNRHLIGVGDGYKSEETLFLLGTDVQGRDLWSRLMLGTQVSLSIGLVGVGLSLILGIVLGGISGYYGGYLDTVIQRVIEITRAVPTIPLWMGLAAALPRHWSVLQVYFAITLIISLFAWTDLARVVRGRFLALREEDFVAAARLAGAKPWRIIFAHMLPSFYSHIIAAVTLAIPAMIVSETSLSFLGLGLRPPAISWGTLLQAAQNIQSVATTPWLLIPAVPVIVAILAFNFLGDGLRDAADPYSN
ncbi:MAG: ABC transporter permease [Caldilineaceae bacterium]